MVKEIKIFLLAFFLGFPILAQTTEIVLNGNVYLRQTGNHWIVGQNNITINSGATWQQGNNSSVLLPGNIIINGSLEQITGQSGFFRFIGNSSSISGSGLSAEFGSIEIDKSTNSTNLTLNRNITTRGNLHLKTGIYDLQIYTSNNTSGTGNCQLDANTRLRIGGSMDLSTSLNNYSNYNININNTIEFYGSTNQIISSIPSNLTGGLGQVELTNSGTKIVNNPLWIRGNLTNYSPATLQVNVVNSLQIDQSIVNNSAIINSGIIEIGQ